jgi:hypothetical protein
VCVLNYQRLSLQYRGPQPALIKHAIHCWQPLGSHAVFYFCLTVDVKKKKKKTKNKKQKTSRINKDIYVAEETRTSYN